MFGLVARIALAIFGALSVISGAALYSAIKESKAIALIAEMNELGKAVESYMIDTGENLPLYDITEANKVVASYGELVSSTKRGWNGPYFPEPINVNNASYKHKVYGSASISYFARSNAWGEEVIPGVDPLFPCGHAGFIGVCEIYARIGLVDKNMIIVLDKKIDNSDGGKNGKIKYQYIGSGESNPTWLLYYKLGVKM